MNTRRRFGLVLAAYALAAACHRPTTTDPVAETVSRSIPAVAIVTEFQQLFPTASHWISHFRPGNAKPQWISKVGLHGRYVLTLTGDAAIDYSRSIVTTLTNIEIMVVEVESISGATIQYGGLRHAIDTNEWKQLVKSNGDLDTIGIKLRKDAAVPGFDSSWKEL